VVEDGTVQGLLETLGVPYVAPVSRPARSGWTILAEAVFANAGIPVTPWIAITEAEFDRDPQAASAARARHVGLPPHETRRASDRVSAYRSATPPQSSSAESSGVLARSRDLGREGDRWP